MAFEADSAAEFLDLVQDLRETESSKYTVRDTPMYTCRRTTVEAILESQGALPVPVALTVLCDAARGLSFANQRGIVQNELAAAQEALGGGGGGGKPGKPGKGPKKGPKPHGNEGD